MRARFISGTLATALLVAATIVNVPPATAVKAPAIISLGDSYISGEAGRWRGNGNYPYGSRYGTDLAAYNCNRAETSCSYDPKLIYGTSAAECDRSIGAEITHVEKVRVNREVFRITPVNRLNIACSGATTTDVTKNSFKGEAPQVQQLRNYASSRDIKLVVLSIGGNDIGFGDIIKSCVTAFTLYYYCNTSLAGPVKQRITALYPKVRDTVRAVQDVMRNAGYRNGSYRMVVQSYPVPMPAGKDNRYPETYKQRFEEGGCPIYNVDADWARNDVLPDLASTIRRAAGATAAEYLELRNALEGHEVCAKGVSQSNSGDTLGHPHAKRNSEWIRWIGGLAQGYVQESLHPNAYGQEQLGACLGHMASRSKNTFDCRIGSV
ncbi:MAG: SGNH/GDSL hydrolase family protein [Actinophytocola sp.]|uniref:SGNH/GDSL hydrolase family protein n=1 Tax=Actinophytocola sp. TaxID=1872138 RepID=UPI003C77071D